jgi:hypothetical protein
LHRIGAVIGEVAERIERAHSGINLLEHGMTIHRGPARGKPSVPVIIR